MEEIDDASHRETASAVLMENRRFIVKLADTPAEVEQALHLRYEVFKLEQGRLAELDGSAGQIDRDEFDAKCLHLLVIDRESGRVAGTYRMQAGERACAPDGGGFYSEREFEIPVLREFAPHVFEVGRSCVAPEFRNGAAVAMLWSGIGAVRRRFGFRYMLGCVSLEHTDGRIGWRIYDILKERRLFCREVTATPRPAYRLERPQPSAEDGTKTEAEQEAFLQRELPPLFKGYLRIGAKICGEPALDSGFGSIDFLIWFDFEQLPEKYVRHFNV